MGSELFSEIGERDVDGVVGNFYVPSAAPGFGDELFSRNDPIRPFEEGFDNRTFVSRKHDGRSVVFGRTARGAVFEFSKAEGIRGRRHRRPADYGAGAGDEFFWQNGLGKIIVSAHVEPTDDVLAVAVGGDENDGRGDFLDGSQVADDVESAAVSKGDVDDVEVRVGLVGIDEVPVSVINAHDESALFELSGYMPGENPFVVHDRNAHVGMVSGI